MHDYDSTLKTLLQGSTGSCLTQLFGRGEQQTVSVERWLNPELPRVRAPRADLLGQTSFGELLHIEIQSDNDADMIIRTAEYGLAIYDKHRRFPKQVVLYVGKAHMSRAQTLRLPDVERAVFQFTCQFVDIRDLDGEALLQSPQLSDCILAVLTRLSRERANLRRILMRIVQEPAGSRKIAFEQLLILAGLRGLTGIIKEEEKHMPVTEKMEDHEYFGPFIRQGRQEGAEELVRLQIGKRFGPLPSDVTDRLAQMSVAELDELGIRLLDAASLDSLFPPKH